MKSDTEHDHLRSKRHSIASQDDQAVVKEDTRRRLLRAVASGAPLMATISPRSALGAQQSFIDRLKTKDATIQPPNDRATADCAAAGSGQWIVIKGEFGKVWYNDNQGNCGNTAPGASGQYLWGIQVQYPPTSGSYYYYLIDGQGSPSNSPTFPARPYSYTNVVFSNVQNAACAFEVDPTRGETNLIALFSLDGGGVEVALSGFWPRDSYSGPEGLFAMHVSTWSSLSPNLPAGTYGC